MTHSKEKNKQELSKKVLVVDLVDRDFKSVLKCTQKKTKNIENVMKIMHEQNGPSNRENKEET